MTITFRAIISVNNQLIYMLMVFFHALSPLLQCITNKVASFVGLTIKHMHLVVFQVENTKGNQFILSIGRIKGLLRLNFLTDPAN